MKYTCKAKDDLPDDKECVRGYCKMLWKKCSNSVQTLNTDGIVQTLYNSEHRSGSRWETLHRNMNL